MEQSVGRMWMIGVSINMARQRFRGIRTTGITGALPFTARYSEYVDFEEDAFGNAKAVKTEERFPYLFRTAKCQFSTEALAGNSHVNYKLSIITRPL